VENTNRIRAPVKQLFGSKCKIWLKFGCETCSLGSAKIWKF